MGRAENTPAGITDAYWHDGGLRSAGIISELVSRKVSNRNLSNPLLSHLFAGAWSFEDLVLIQFEKRFLDRRRGPAILFNRLVILSSPRRAPTERDRVEALC